MPEIDHLCPDPGPVRYRSEEVSASGFWATTQRQGSPRSGLATIGKRDTSVVRTRDDGCVESWLRGAIAVASGLSVSWLAFAAMTRNYESISEFHLAQAKPGGRRKRFQRR